MYDEHDEDPLVKEVPGHLFEFEETIFGMSLIQLLSDMGAGVVILLFTGSLQLFPRIVASALLAILVLVLVHGRAEGQTLLHWLYLYGRQAFIPRRSAWRSPIAFGSPVEV